MNVPNDTLTRWRAFADRVRGVALGLPRVAREGRAELVDEVCGELVKTAIAAGAEMEQYGAERSGKMPPRPAVPLHLLDTSASRHLLASLDEAARAARAVDEERGWGEGGLANLLSAMRDDVRQEVLGPTGSEGG